MEREAASLFYACQPNSIQVKFWRQELKLGGCLYQMRSIGMSYVQYVNALVILRMGAFVGPKQQRSSQMLCYGGHSSGNRGAKSRGRKYEFRVIQ